MKSNSPNINRYWADLIVEELLRLGVDCFYLSPGSRNSPLVAAIGARRDARSAMHFDERGGCFAALGSGKRSGIPAVWITTSGTAVANGLPAVVEASQSFVPLILLTADRPFELRDVGSNQAIDQVGIFEKYARWSVDLPAPSSDVGPEAVLSMIGQAFLKATSSPAGPVHINMPFREPLAPDAADFDVLEDGIARWLKGGSPYVTSIPGRTKPSRDGMTVVRTAVREAKRGMFVVGGIHDREQANDILFLAEKWQWPVLADVTSQIRLGSSSNVVMASPHFAAKFGTHEAPDAVLRFGAAISSKAIHTRLKTWQPTVLAVVTENLERNDPEFVTTHRIVADTSLFCEEAGEWAMEESGDWLARWTEPNLADSLASITENDAPVTEPGAARRLTQLVPADHVLYVAGSMPVRDLDMFADGSGNNPWVGANRGASGIDGTVASSVGAARSVEQRATIVCGDLALLHDLNSLALLKGRSDVVVVINNDGGGIFSFLPIAEYRDIFEPWFGTPHGLTFEPAARMFGLRYTAPQTIGDFSKAYNEALSSSQSTLIEIHTDRSENINLHRELDGRIAALY